MYYFSYAVIRNNILQCQRIVCMQIMATNNENNPNRVMLWSVPRTVSTVIAKFMSFVDGSQVVFEPYCSAYHVGPEMVKFPPSMEAKVGPMYQFQKERINNTYLDAEHAFDEDVCTYSWAKGQLECDYPGKSLIFCKDMAYGLQGKYDMLPEGYRHTFLIRHPHKIFMSWRKMFSAFVPKIYGTKEFRMCDLPSFLIPSKYGYAEQYELYQYIKDNIDPSPIVMDADDLLSNPKSVLSQYCNEVGIPFSESLLEWPSDSDVMKKWKACRRFVFVNSLDTGGFYDAALHSTKFNPPKKIPPLSALSEDVVPCVEASMPLYQQMYETRIKPQED